MVEYKKVVKWKWKQKPFKFLMLAILYLDLIMFAFFLMGNLPLWKMVVAAIIFSIAFSIEDILVYPKRKVHYEKIK